MQEEFTIGKEPYRKTVKSKYYGKILRTVTNNKEHIAKVRQYYWDNYKYAHDYINAYNQRVNNAFQNYANQKIDSRELPSIAVMMLTTSDEMIENGRIEQNKFNEFLDKMIADFSYKPLEDPEFLNKHLDESQTDELGLKPSERARYERTKPYFEHIYKNLDDTVNIEKNIYKKAVNIEKNIYEKQDNFAESALNIFKMYFSMRFAQGYFNNINPKSNYEYVKDHYKTLNGRTAFNKSMDINNTFTNQMSMIFDENGLDKSTNPDINIEADEMKMDYLLNEGSVLVNFNHKYDRLAHLSKSKLLTVDANYAFMQDFGRDLDGLAIKSNGLFGYYDVLDQIYVNGKKLSTLSKNRNGGEKRVECLKKLMKEIHKGSSVIELISPKQLGNYASFDIIPLKFQVDNEMNNKNNLPWYKKIFYKMGLYKGTDVNKKRDETYEKAKASEAKRHERISKDVKKYIDSMKCKYVSSNYDEKIQSQKNVVARHSIEVNEIRNQINLNKELLESNSKLIENLSKGKEDKNDAKAK